MPGRKPFTPEQRERNRLTRQKHVREANHRFRLLILEEFGGECVRCGFADKRALQIDHVRGGGSRDKIGRTPFHRAMYNKVRERFIAGELQLLCANCNWIKRYEAKEVGETQWTKIK